MVSARFSIPLPREPKKRDYWDRSDLLPEREERQRAETRARGGDGDLEEAEEKRLMLQQVGEVRLIAVSMPPSACYWRYAEFQSFVRSQLSLRCPHRRQISSVVSKWKMMVPPTPFFYFFIFKNYGLFLYIFVKNKKPNPPTCNSHGIWYYITLSWMHAPHQHST